MGVKLSNSTAMKNTSGTDGNEWDLCELCRNSIYLCHALACQNDRTICEKKNQKNILFQFRINQFELETENGKKQEKRKYYILLPHAPRRRKEEKIERNRNRKKKHRNVIVWNDFQLISREAKSLIFANRQNDVKCQSNAKRQKNEDYSISIENLNFCRMDGCTNAPRTSTTPLYPLDATV